ncbi:unnamed protein product [Amoebophrya sp. A120]|nr:unnamed protein product [Amoebophrya sp. A120]|eukprot:GSA120T00003335001.1
MWKTNRRKASRPVRNVFSVLLCHCACTFTKVSCFGPDLDFSAYDWLRDSFKSVDTTWISNLLSNHSIGYDFPPTPERLCLTRKPPCTLWQLSARDTTCDRRIVPCGTHENDVNKNAFEVYLQRLGQPSVVTLGGTDGSRDSDCAEGGRIDPYADASKQLFLVRFQPPMHPVCWEVLMRAGECWIPENSQAKEAHEFGCLGRCGGKCGGVFCSNWGGDCLRNDVCRYFLGDECDIKGAARDWKSTCLFGFHHGACESVRGNPLYHQEDRICGGAWCPAWRYTDYFVPRRTVGQELCSELDQKDFDNVMCRSDCVTCTDLACVQRCHQWQQRFPFCRCTRQWPATQFVYDGPFSPTAITSGDEGPATTLTSSSTVSPTSSSCQSGNLTAMCSDFCNHANNHSAHASGEDL